MNENKELDYKALVKELNELSEKYEFFKFTYIGNSLLNRPIPLITLGDDSAKKSVLYVATHHACENICTSLLLRFIKEYIQAYTRLGQICQINLRYLFKMRKI